MVNWIKISCQRYFLVQQLNIVMKLTLIMIHTLLLELMPSSAYFALSGLKMPKIGLIDQEATDGRPVKQSLKLFRTVAMLYTLSTVLVETTCASGDCHFLLQK